MQQEIRFCRAADGARIAYATTGSGPPLVKAANWLNHLEYDWESPVWRHIFSALSRDQLLVRYDERGNGLSDWEADDISFEAFVRDLESVVDAAGLEQFALLGISQGCPVSIAYAIRHPERVTRLVLHGGYSQGWKKRGTPEEEARCEALTTLMKAGWGQDNPAFRQVFTTLFLPQATAEESRAFNELQRRTTSPENAVRIWRAIGAIDVASLLPKVSCPTLVLHSRSDAVVPFEAGRYLATSIPGARFVPLESPNHLVLAHEPAWPRFLSEVRGFLLDRGGARDWAKVDALFAEALERSPSERSSWLETATSDEGLRRQLARLLELAETSDDRLRSGGGVAAAISAELSSGDRLGNYEILGVIGRGGMGTVYRARNPILGRDVAIKALSSGVAPGKAELKRFEREAKLLASLSHPNIAAIYDCIVVDEMPHLVLELVPGETLSERLARGPLPLEEALRIAGEIAVAVGEAHRRGIVHRDLKPANVKLDTSGRVKVLDFGLAKSLAATSDGEAPPSSATTLHGAVLGTPRYMSPEQARAEKADERADVWAFGCLLYELLAGVPAFGGNSVSEAIASVLRDDVDFDALPRSTPPAVVALLRRCLEKDPAKRLSRIEEARSVLSRAEEPAGRSLRWALAVVGVLLLALLLYFLAR